MQLTLNIKVPMNVIENVNVMSTIMIFDHQDFEIILFR